LRAHLNTIEVQQSIAIERYDGHSRTSSSEP